MQERPRVLMEEIRAIDFLISRMSVMPCVPRDIAESNVKVFIIQEVMKIVS